MRVTCNVFLKDISNFFKNLNMPLKFSEFNITLRLVDSIYVTDQPKTTQTLVSANLYVDQVTLHEMEEIQFVKNYNNFDVNISFLENFVIRDSQNITNQEFNIGVNNCTNTNDMFLMLVEVLITARPIKDAFIWILDQGETVSSVTRNAIKLLRSQITIENI